MLDLFGGPMQSAMSTTFTWLSVIATAFEVLCRLRSYLRRRSEHTVVKVKPARRGRALARPHRRARSQVAAAQLAGRIDRLKYAVFLLPMGWRGQ